MPKEARNSAISRQYRAQTQPYSTHTTLPSSTASMTTMTTMTSPPSSHVTNLSSNFMTSPMQERASAAWTEEDDQRLMEYRAKGQNWVIISEKFPGKTGNACRKRHERLIEKRNANHLDGVRLSDLATAYVECREIMWKMVADRVGGERWQIIEQKCMEKGVKTLTTNARAQRRNQSHPQMTPHESMDPNARAAEMDFPVPNADFYAMEMHGKVPNAYSYFGQGQQDMSGAFYPHQAPSTTHSRRASVAHSIGQHSVDAQSRSGSHGPMQPPQSTNPFASPHQVSTQYFSTNTGGLAMAPTLSTQHYPATTMAAGMHQQQHVTTSSGLPSITSAFDVPRLPSIMSTQG